MADSTAAKSAAKNVKDVLIDRVKDHGKLSLTLGAGVAVVTFGVLTTVLATNAVIGAGQGVVDGIKTVRNRV